MKAFERISCHKFVEVDGYAYFSNWFYNGLFRVEIETGKTFFLGSFEGERLCEANIHKEIFIKDGYIYFCPRRGGHVHIYDLGKKSLYSVSLKISDKEFFVTGSVFLEEKAVYFIPEQKGFSVRKLDLKSWKITEENRIFKNQTDSLAGHKDIFPDPELLEKYHIERAAFFSWNQIYSMTWYGFLPMGCQLLKYTEGKDKIEKIPLNVINRAMLDGHLQDVREEALRGEFTVENKYKLNVQDFLDCIKRRSVSKNDGFKGKNYMKNEIWNSLCER